MAEAENEAAFLSSMQAMNESAGGYSNTGDASGEQIDSSDEYDPAQQDVQDSSLPGPSNPDLSNQSSDVPQSNHPSRPASAQLPSDVHMQTDTVQSPSGASEAVPQTSPSGPNGAEDVTRPASTVTAQAAANAPAVPKARLPHDKIGILEDRIKEDEKGDTDAWLSLIEEHKARGKIDEARKTYERYLSIFPLDADRWVRLVQMLNEVSQKAAVEDVFGRVLQGLDSVTMWSLYLDHVQRYHNVTTDTTGNARAVITNAYEHVMLTIGHDKDAGQLWLNYIQFIKSGPGVPGEPGWQSSQKMDALRRIYQRAVCIPTQFVEAIWKEFSTFEVGLNKITGRAAVQKFSPDYMSARSAYTELQNMTRDLKNTTLPTLPPATHFEGHEEYMVQVEIWRRIIQWEKDDPLVFKDDDPATYKNRVVHAYKQALKPLFFWPELWYEAAEFCFENDLESQGNDFLSRGMAGNPESSLLAFYRADRLELTTTNGNDDSSKEERGKKVRAVYDSLLDALYDLNNKVMEGEARQIAQVEAEFPDASNGAQTNGSTNDGDGDNEREGNGDDAKNAIQKNSRINMIKTMHSVRTNILNKSISHAWIALMRAMQRMQGKGKPGATIGGSRQIFADARKRGRITGEVWTASALLEFHNTDSESAKRIFERGLKLFPEDETYSLEYIKLLTNTNDNTNARVVFEKSVDRLLQKPETAQKAKALFAFFHRYESQYGELDQIIKLEKRMREAFPEDPRLSAFSQRYVTDHFDPAAVRPIISPMTQARPKLPPMPSIEQQHERPKSLTPVPPPAAIPAPVLMEAPPPVPQPLAVPTPPVVYAAPVINSPKRPFPVDDFNPEPPRKLARGESPLAGAAGRRLNQAKQSRGFDGAHSATPGAAYMPPPPPIPRDVLFLLSIIPPAHTYNRNMEIDPRAVLRVMNDIQLPPSASMLPPRPPTAMQQMQPAQVYQMPPGQYPGPMHYSR